MEPPDVRSTPLSERLLCVLFQLSTVFLIYTLFLSYIMDVDIDIDGGT
jgi:hypothetical protein